MRLTLSIALAAAVLTVAGTRIGQSASDITEYDAVSADGPYSFLPVDHASSDAPAEAMTAEEALATGAFLDMLASDPALAPLDAPARSATALQLAGL